jgi:hypothetical protein
MKFFINGNIFQDLILLILKKNIKFIKEFFKKINPFSMMKKLIFNFLFRNIAWNLLNVIELITRYLNNFLPYSNNHLINISIFLPKLLRKSIPKVQREIPT